MDSIFPGLGNNPFNTKPLVDFFNTSRKSDSQNSAQPSAGYPASGRESESTRSVAGLPGRGRLIDYMA